MAQWLSRGRSVHLVDGQEVQLRDAIDFIRQLQQQQEHGNETTGSIFTHAPNDLKTALLDSWLVVEVWIGVPWLSHADMGSACQREQS